VSIESSMTSVTARLTRLVRGISYSKFWNYSVLRVISTLFVLCLFGVVVTVPLGMVEQGIFGVVIFLIATKIKNLPWGRGGILIMMSLSLVLTFRYLYWRFTETLNFETVLDACFGYTLLSAELYGFLCLILGYVQTAWPLERKSVVITTPMSEWPSVDVLIPTYNESLDVVKLTVLAALTLDWPADKLRVYLLDDGRREDFKQFAQDSGAIYLTRDNNLHAKAGNLNAALAKTNGDFVAIFDCDHIATRSFLQITMGSFLKDPKLAMVQTPHYFFSPDPFERNLKTFRVIPNEGELFYGLVQDGNDVWNASFFCGSCAVLRRAPLEEVGGVAVETVTEDAHTALKLSRRGYNMAYLAIPQAAGLATENLASHIGQRIRWARGMAQIFRVDNPLLGRGLTLGQRLCYVNAMLHFFYGLPRLIFLTAPFAYLFFGAHVFSASTMMVVVYALPPICLASITNSTIQGKFRHSFWNEVYETVLAWYITRPVLLAMINPKSGLFNVTAKGGIIEKEYYDFKIAAPYVILLLMNFVGLAFCLVDVTFGHGERLTALVNGLWVLYNTIILSASAFVANESKQIRQTPRVTADLNVMITKSNGRTLMCQTSDFSRSGLGLKVPANVDMSWWDIGEQVNVSMFRGEKESVFPGRVSKSGKTIGIFFKEDMSLDQRKEFAMMTFGRADTWARMWGKSEVDKPLASFKEVIAFGAGNIVQLVRNGLRRS